MFRTRVAVFCSLLIVCLIAPAACGQVLFGAASLGGDRFQFQLPLRHGFGKLPAGRFQPFDLRGERYRRLASTDENASTIAELGIGTSHTIEKKYLTTRYSGGMAGYVHIAIGRNNDIGGQTWSGIHADGLLNRPTVMLDEETVVKDGRLI